jgi:hypothetical protein
MARDSKTGETVVEPVKDEQDNHKFTPAAHTTTKCAKCGKQKNDPVHAAAKDSGNFQVGEEVEAGGIEPVDVKDSVGTWKTASYGWLYWAKGYSWGNVYKNDDGKFEAEPSGLRGSLVSKRFDNLEKAKAYVERMTSANIDKTKARGE